VKEQAARAEEARRLQARRLCVGCNGRSSLGVELVGVAEVVFVAVS